MRSKDVAQFQTFDQAMKVAIRYLRDLGYECCRPVSAGWKPGEHDKTVRLTITAQRGPGVTRRTPEEQLRVDVRVTGFNRKTLRPRLVSEQPGAR